MENRERAFTKDVVYSSYYRWIDMRDRAHHNNRSERSERDLRRIFREIRAEKRFNELMSRHTSIKVGGIADLIIYPDSIDDLKKIVDITKEFDIPIFILGNGTNIVVRDNGIRGVVVSLSEGFSGIDLLKITNDRTHLCVEAGGSLSKLIRFARDHGLSGLEPLAGIPGSVGGAVIMNAGAHDREIGDLIKAVKFLDKDGTVRIIDAARINFGYRSSDFPKGSIILAAEIVLQKGDKKKIGDNISHHLNIRKKNAENMPSAGSVFKNPPDNKAYKIIDSIGMRGECIGGAMVSTVHSNFIVNKGDAKGSDIIKLINKIKMLAMEKLGINLEREVIIVGEGKNKN